MKQAQFEQLLENALNARGRTLKRDPPAVGRRAPCLYLDQQKKYDLGCRCKAYACSVHQVAVASGRGGRGIQHCSNCKDYVESVPPKAGEPLDVVIGVTTCPLIRDGKVAGHRDTLPRTLQSILDAGWGRDQVTIFAEPESRVPDGWRVIWRDRRYTPFWNLYHGMKQLLSEHGGVQGQIWVEDDTWFAPHAKSELVSLPEPLGMLQIFRMSGRGNPWRTADSLCEHRRSDGYQKLKKGQYLWGSNAIYLPRESCEYLAGLDVGKGLSDSPDVKLSRLLMKRGLWCCNPSLAQTDHKLPSATGHNVTSRMTSDTFSDSQKIHIVYPKDGWVLESVAKSFDGFSLGVVPNPNACNVYMNYALFDPGNRTACDVAYFTHYEPGPKGNVFDRATAADWCIGMNSETLLRLPAHKRSLMVLPVDKAYEPRRPIVLGVCSRQYRRKRFDVAEALRDVPNVDVRITGGKVPDADMPAWFDRIDYLLVTSDIEGGPMSVLEALGKRKPVIAPDVGWCWNYPVIRYKDEKELRGIVQALANPSPSAKAISDQLRRICEQAIQSKNPRGDRYSQLIEIIHQNKPQSIIEIGTWNGERAEQMIRAAMEHHPKVHYDGYDLFEDATSELDKAEMNVKPHTKQSMVTARLTGLQKAYPGLTFTLHKGRTVDTLKNQSADLAFIDGGHSVETIAHDYRQVMGSTTVVLDDYYEPDGNGDCPDVMRFGCNQLVTDLRHSVLPIAGRVAGGGLVKMVVVR